MAAAHQPQPVRSSLLFSPVVESGSATAVSSSANISETDLESTNSSSTSLNPNFNSYQHQRRRSDFRSKSTDQIIPNSVLNPVMSSTTLYPNNTSNTTSNTTSNNGSSKFSSVNISQPALRPAPMAPVPMIPATRFDTITSYVDIIYQHQHQQHHQNHQNNQNNQELYSASNIAEGDLEAQETGNDASLANHAEDENVVYLDPSDGIDGDQSFMATCPRCAMMVMTEIEPFTGKYSRKMALFLSPLLLCWLPYYKSSKTAQKWMDVRHSCPKCQSIIAIYRK